MGRENLVWAAPKRVRPLGKLETAQTDVCIWISIFVGEKAMAKISMMKQLAVSMSVVLLLTGAMILPVMPVQAQTSFNSGSTGENGAFAPPANTTQTIQVPPSGVFNFTSVNIPGNTTVIFTRNAANTPITILATLDVTIAGTIRIDGQTSSSGNGGLGGPGGYNGGSGGFGFNPYAGITGDGPGGGGGGGSINGANFGGGGGGGFASGGTNGSGQNIGQGGASYGSAAGIPFVGGAGGGGGGAALNKFSGGGGGGGGAILIASSGSITLSSFAIISAVGGGGARVFAAADGGSGGGGAGGLVRLVANTIIADSNTRIFVSGGNGGGFGFGGSINGGNGGAGYIRVEAFDRSAFLAGTSSIPINFALPGPVTLANAPRLRITSVGGIAAPASPLGSMQGAPDITVPSSQSNPVSISIEATNIPLSTTIQINVIPSSGTRSSFQSNALTGSEASSTTTANVTLPGGMSVLVATAVVDTTLASVRPIFVEGERVTRMEIAASLGGASEVTYVTASGRRITRTE
jgi:hypothetical protein